MKDGTKTNPSCDLIKRKDAIEAMWKKCENAINVGDYAYTAYGVERILSSLPSADATIGDYPNDLISRSALMEYCSNQKSKSIDNNDIARFPSADKSVNPSNAEVVADYISRADAIKAVGEWMQKEYGYLDLNRAERLIDALSALPSAEGGDAKTNPIPEGTGLMQPSPNNGADLISRGLAMERIANDNVSGGMNRINEYNNSTEFNNYLDGISDAITTIFCDVPSADITETETCQKCQDVTEKVLNRQGDEIKRLKASAEADDRLYIKIYADDEPSVKAEKLYQICGETQNREVTEWLKEYFPSAEAEPTQAEKCENCIHNGTNKDNMTCKECASAEAVQGEWIPCSERLPNDLEAVNVTWVNHNPPVYYQFTKDVPNVDTAVYHRGAWYWWDATVIDLLGEYDGAYVHGIEPIDKYIEIIAWMPLPTPYKGGDDE